jgi:CheY-like chemotaxis protein
MDKNRFAHGYGSPAAARVILAVDDDEDVRRIASASLRRLGFVVIEAHDADEAMRILADRSHRIDLLFTDVRMPGPFSGPALAEMAARQQPSLRVLLTSGNPGNIGRNGGLARFPVLAKPYRRADLAAAIEAALGTTPAMPT